MAKGVSIKFKSYSETVPKLLSLIKLQEELKNHDTIVLKPFLQSEDANNTRPEFVEEVLKFCLENKAPQSKVFIAEGADGEDTIDIFDRLGYVKLAEKYSVGLIDLNTAEVNEVRNPGFMKFDGIMYPKILSESFIISLPPLSEHPELEITGALANMIGAYPSKYYKGFFTKKKTKIRGWPMRYSIHDMLKCKLPEFAIIDASEKGFILAGQPLEIDKQSVKLLGKEWKTISHLKLAHESFPEITIEKAQTSVQ